MEQKQYFIGFNRRDEELILGLLEIGGTLMFYYHPVTAELNKKYEFYSGEWMLYTDVFPDFGIDKINEFIHEQKLKDKSLKIEVIPYKNILSN